jgi:microcompartment protein CcmK/EutM
MKRNQSSLDCFSVDAGVDHLVLVHAHSEVLQHSLQREVLDRCVLGIDVAAKDRIRIFIDDAILSTA